MTATGWHEGERALQQRAGVGARMAEVGARVLRDHMPDQHRAFFSLLPFVLAASLDEEGAPTVSLLSGPEGFAHSPEPRLLRIEAQWPRAPRPGEPVGLLGLQAHTGRRNRMNGWIAAADATGFSVRVGQSFGNCPKYIHPREAFHVAAAGETRVAVLPALDAEARRLVAAADTFFIATAHPGARAGGDPSAGLDMSHRGGPAGFAQVVDPQTLLVPDFVGNSFFNTFGNLQLEPRCALLFVDYATGERLHVAARAELLWDGAGRRLRIAIERVERVRGGLPLRWEER